MPVADAAAQLFGLVRLLTIAVTWSRFAGGATAAFAEGPLAVGLSVLFWVFSILAFLGIRARLTTLLTGLTCFAIYYALGVYGPLPALDSHHVFAQALLTCLVALTPCDHALALQIRPGPVPLWSQNLLRLQISVLYLGGVYEKSYAGWLDGTRFEQILHTIYLGSDAVDLGHWSQALAAMAIGVWLAELFLAVAVWIPRMTGPMLLVAFLLHGGIYLGTPVGTFSATMFVLLLAVVPPAQFARVLNTDTVRSPGPAWLLVPLMLGPIWGLSGWGPAVRALDGLALQACDVELSVNGVPLQLPERTRHEGLLGVTHAAARACRQRGPVDVDGRCASSEGWQKVDWEAVCPDVPRLPSGRRSAW